MVLLTKLLQVLESNIIMQKRDKQRAVFIKLVNKQLEPHGKIYEDVVNDSEWYMRYKTTQKAEREFIKWGTDLIRNDLKLNVAAAEREMSWFILQWGLTTSDYSASPAKKSKPKNNIKRASK
jgi:hypothetical protein